MGSPFAELRKIQTARIDVEPEEVLVNEKILELYGWKAESLRAPVSYNNYGEPILDGVGQYFRELHAYRQGGMAGHDKLFHMVNAIKLDNPEFQFESRGYINSGALRVLKACCEQNDLGIAGSASAGKTYPVAAYILQDWKSAPNCTLSFVCTTSMSASDDRIWGAIVKMFQQASHPIGTYIPHKSVIAWGKFSESASDRDFNSAIKALAIETGKEGKKAIDTLRGRKQLNVRLVFDELPEMELYVTQGAINLESNTADPQNNAFGLQVIGIGNPNNPNDAHGQMCKPDHPLGFKSITKETREWKTRTGHAIFLNGEWCANFEAGLNEPIPFPRLTNRIGIAAMLKRCYGKKNSLQYWRNAIGFWPDASVIQTVMSEELLNTSHAYDTVLWNTSRRKILCGFDTGFTAGGDKCVAQFGEFGTDANGRKILQWGTEKIYMIERGGVFEDQLAEALVNDCIHFGVKPEDLGMDISGDGGKIYRAIVRYWNSIVPNAHAEDVFAISSMGAASDRIVSQVDPRLCSDAFDRRVTEYWMMAREGILCEVIKGLPKEGENPGELHPIVSQLCTRVYSIKNKKMCVETKDDMKLRTLGVSPDCFIAGTLILTVNGNIPIEQIKKGDLIITPFGISPVLAIHNSLVNETCLVNFSNGSTLEGKGKHKIFTFDNGWTPLNKLSLTNEMASDIQLPLWNILNSLFTKTENTDFKILVDIIKMRTGTTHLKDFYTDLYGLRTMVLFQKAWSCIIKIMTGQITISKISNSKNAENISAIISERNSKTLNFVNKIKFTYKKLKSKLQNGISQTPEESPIAEAPKRSGIRKNLPFQFVLSVKENSQIAIQEKQNTAQPHVNKLQSVKLIEKIEIASSVIRSLIRFAIIKPSIVPVNVQPIQHHEKREVFNLTLKNHNVYFANGILVANCADAFTYLAEMARKAGLIFNTPSERKRQDERRKVEEHQTRQLVTQGNYESDSWGED